MQVSAGQSYLSRALGFDARIEIDYQALPIEPGDAFLLATDGVYEHVDAAFMVAAVQDGRGDLDRAARAIVDEALRRGSADNLTVQIVVVETLPGPDARRPAPAGARAAAAAAARSAHGIDGYPSCASCTAAAAATSTWPSTPRPRRRSSSRRPRSTCRATAAYLERFLMEEWVARRIDSAHVLRPHAQTRKRSYLYVVTEFIDGQTLCAVDDRPPEARRGDRARHRRADRPRACRPSTGWRCCTRTCGPTTS